MIPPRAGDLSSRLHEAGQPILPSELLHLADGCMAPLQLAILKLEDNLLKDENPNYPVFTVKVPDFVDFVDESPADLDRKSTRLNSSHSGESRMPSSA